MEVFLIKQKKNVAFFTYFHTLCLFSLLMFSLPASEQKLKRKTGVQPEMYSSVQDICVLLYLNYDVCVSAVTSLEFVQLVWEADRGLPHSWGLGKMDFVFCTTAS